MVLENPSATLFLDFRKVIGITSVLVGHGNIHVSPAPLLRQQLYKFHLDLLVPKIRIQEPREFIFTSQLCLFLL